MMLNMEYNEGNPIVVSIKCLAYNHEKFIRDALDGFVMQKTTFRFEAIVHDDASTDGTADIIREYAERYPEIIKPIFETENQYSKHDGSLNRIVGEKLIGKYIAMCEGDDYWDDPYKLQKQVDFMEAHPDYSMCFHPADYLKGDAIVSNDAHFAQSQEVNPEQIISGGGLYCATASLLFRREIMDVEIPRWRVMSDVGDYPLQIQLSLMGRIWCFSDTMCVYRVGNASSWVAMHGKDLSHYRTEIDWLKELDHDTQGKYQKSIYYRIVFFSIPLCRSSHCTPCELLGSYGKLDKKDQCQFRKRVIKAILHWMFSHLRSTVSN